MSVDAGPVRVLVADGDAAMRQACRAALARLFGANVHVREATTPEQALDLVREGPVHLVLSGYLFVSRLNGIDLLEAVARERPEAMRVLMTAHAAPDMVVEAANRARVHGFLPKPLRADALEEGLARLLTSGP